MSVIPPVGKDARTVILVVGVVGAVLLGTLLIVVLQTGSGGGVAGGVGPTTTSTPTVHSHGWGVNTGLGRSAPPGPATVYSHTYGIVGSTSGTGPGGVLAVYSNASAVSAGPTTSTPTFPVVIGSAVFVFVGYSNEIIGGGSVTSVTDSLGDTYSQVTSTGLEENHSEDLYVAEPIPANASLTVSVTFSTGATTLGGSVSAIDVNGTAIPFVDGSAADSGWGGPAYASFSTENANDLLLFGFSGQGKDTPFSPTSPATLINTGNGTSGPFTNGEGYATYAVTETGTSAQLSADLANPAVWNGIGVGLVGCDGCFSSASTTTPSVQVAAGSTVFAFVGYPNALSGGATETSVTDSLGDFYTPVAATGFAENQSEELYESGPIPYNTTDSLTVSFSEGASSNGGSVGVVDVAGSGTPFVDAVYHQSGSGGTASVLVTTNHTNDLLLLGLSGPAGDTPFTAIGGGTLLDTINDTGAPPGTAVGFATYSYSEVGSNANLSAELAHPGVWNAIGVGILACNDCNSTGSTTTTPINVAAGSSLFVFVGYVNGLIGGGGIESVTDSSGDVFSVVGSTEFYVNHTEELLVGPALAASAALTVSVTVVGGATTMGAAVAVVDVVGSGTLSVDGSSSAAGDNGTAVLALATDHANDLVLFGVAGQEKDAPFAPGPGETLLDTAGNITGPFDDGMGFGTFYATPGSTTNVALSATLATPAVWAAIGVGIADLSLSLHAGTPASAHPVLVNELSLTAAPGLRRP